jgi:exosortase O
MNALHPLVWLVVLAVHAEGLAWIARGLASPSETTRATLVTALIVVLVVRTPWEAVRRRLGARPRLTRAGLAVLALGTLGVTVPGMAPVRLVRAVWAVCAVVGLLTTLVDDEEASAVLWGVPVGIGLLPVSTVLDVYLGFPARELAASAASAALGVGGLSLSTGTVLAWEGRVAYVDNPCSGVEGLWVATLVWVCLAASQRRRPTLSWALLGVAFVASVWATNVLRVVALVALLRWEQPLLAEAFHLPLGLLGFVGSLAVAVGLDRLAPLAALRPARRAGGLPVVMLGSIVGLAMPAPARSVAVAPEVAMVPGLVPMALTETEARFAASQGSHLAKGRAPELGATVLLNTAARWGGHHLPRHCLAASGLDVSGAHPALVAGEIVRAATVRRGDEVGTVVWWFASADTRTDDHVRRILADDGRPWTLATVLLAGARELDDPEVAGLVTDIRDHVSAALDAVVLEMP